jgi:hypothetical protein
VANTLAVLRGKLDTQLNDTAHDAWDQTEKEELITQAVNNLYPRFARPFSTAIYPLTADTENYAVPAGMMEVHRVEVGEVATDLLVRVLDGGTWYTYNNALTDELEIFVNARYSDADHYYILHGIGRYTLTSGSTPDQLIPDALVPMVLADARSEAYRRIVGQRARFEQWQAASHEQDVTVNELLALTQEAQANAERVRARLPRTVRRPVPGRLSS